MQHDWVPSTLGHGETMCSRCLVTNREAAAIRMFECEPSPPKAANANVQAQIDDHLYDDDGDCALCGGAGVIEDECTCMDDTCCCLNPSPPVCPACKGRGI